MSTSFAVHIPSTKVASSNVISNATSVCGGGVGSCPSAERPSTSVGVLVSSPSHYRSVDFLQYKASLVSNTRMVVHLTTPEFRKDLQG
jgi:hypothetical protein